MIRTLHLGREGEETAESLLNLYQWSDSFEFCVLASAYRNARDEVRRRLGEAAERLVVLRPDDTLPQRLPGIVEQQSTDTRRCVFWLEQEKFDPEALVPTLTFVQMQRDVFFREAPWLWVLAGPPELVELVNRYATHLVTGMSINLLKQEPQTLPATTQPIRWLHLSDFHFKALERWDRRATLTALLKHARKLRDGGLGPDLVFVTGDVAQSGKHKEYEQAERFLPSWRRPSSWNRAIFSSFPATTTSIATPSDPPTV